MRHARCVCVYNKEWVLNESKHDQVFVGFNIQGSVHRKYEGNSISKLQIQVATYVF